MGPSSSRQENDTWGYAESLKEISVSESLLGFAGEDVILGAGTVEAADALVAKRTPSIRPTNTTGAAFLINVSRVGFCIPPSLPWLTPGH